MRYLKWYIEKKRKKKKGGGREKLPIKDRSLIYKGLFCFIYKEEGNGPGAIPPSALCVAWLETLVVFIEFICA